jgi:hypothetical protein
MTIDIGAERIPDINQLIDRSGPELEELDSEILAAVRSPGCQGLWGGQGCRF